MNAGDSGSHFYNTYQCADGKWVSLGAIEKKFYKELLERLELDPAHVGDQWNADNWQRAQAIVAERIRSKTRDEWTAILEGTDVCFAPILSFDEAPSHPHFVARDTFIEIDGIVQPAPAPRFGRTSAGVPTPPEPPSPETEALAGWIDEKQIADLSHRGVLPSRTAD